METVRQVLDRAKKHSISLNPRKVVFAESSAPFGGFIVDAEGFRPDPALLSAISQFLFRHLSATREFFSRHF